MSLRLKTILGVGFIEAILLLALITTVLSYMRKSNESNLEDYVATTTTLFASTTKDAVLSFDLASLENFVEAILTNKGLVYTRIFDNDNNLLASGGDSQYLNKSFQLDARYQDVTDAVYDASKQITVDGIPYGRIEMGFSTEGIEKAITEARRLAVTIAIIEMSLVALFSFFLGVYLTKQLKVLNDSARRIADGDLAQKITVKARDEIGEVADSFNKMMFSLNRANQEAEKYQIELIALNKTLEDRVEKRTQKIFEQKEKLESAYGKLQEAQEQLIQSEKMASIGQLAAGVAHEINNPVSFVKSNLSSLAGYIDTYKELIDKQKKILSAIELTPENNIRDQLTELSLYCEDNDVDFINEDIDGLVEESIKGTNRVTEIVKGLSVYSRSSDEVMEECDVNALIGNVLTMLGNELKYSCEVITQLGDLPFLQCHPGKITQVITNLVINAMHSMDEEGVLTISSVHQKTATTSNVVIQVLDTGKGIAEENIVKLFDPFFTTKPVGEGTGLGLSISQGIICDHGGTISVENVAGKGALFTITLPAPVNN
jgi:two-component system NtrC family sensor kinase